MIRVIWTWLVACIGATAAAFALDRRPEYVLLAGVMIGRALSAIFAEPNDEN
jgi:hypothetical protein